MSFHRLPNYNITLDFSDDVGAFDFNSLPLGGSAGGINDSAASISGSSYAPLSCGPHTPTSDRSTPPFSTFDVNALDDFGLPAGASAANMRSSSLAASSYTPQTPTSDRSSLSFSASFDLASSFASSVDPVPFDLTPPSSATSTYFPMTPAGSFSEAVHPAFPVTPSRQLGFRGQPLSSPGSQMTPSQTMEYDFFVNQLGSHSLISTPSALARSNHMSDTTSHWAYPDSPISFDQQSPSSVHSSMEWVKHEREENGMDMPASTARRRTLMAEARQRTTALRQQVEQCSAANPRVRTKRENKAHTAISVDGKVRVARAGAFKCPRGCRDKVFQRKEHMMRHVRT
jgi:hypothetical protein